MDAALPCSVVQYSYVQIGKTVAGFGPSTSVVCDTVHSGNFKSRESGGCRIVEIGKPAAVEFGPIPDVGIRRHRNSGRVKEEEAVDSAPPKYSLVSYL